MTKVNITESINVYVPNKQIKPLCQNLMHGAFINLKYFMSSMGSVAREVVKEHKIARNHPRTYVKLLLNGELKPFSSY